MACAGGPAIFDKYDSVTNIEIGGLGTGGVSVTALILAKAVGATTIVTSSSDEKLDFVQTRHGADYRINYKTTPDWASEVQRITDGKGVDHVIEVGGPGTSE